MKYFIRLFVASLFIASCFAPPVQTDISSQIPTVVAPTPNYTSNNQSSYNNSNNSNNNSDNNNSDTCEDDNDCEDICEEIFKKADNKHEDKCKEDLSVSAVEDMQDAYDIIEEADEDDLDDLNISDLEEIMDISIKPIEYLLSRYSNREARDFFLWLFNEDNEDALDLFMEEDDDYEMLEAALLRLNSGDVIAALGKNIGEGSIFEYLVVEEYDKGIDWIHDFFADGTDKNKNKACSNNKCIFDKYCRVTEVSGGAFRSTIRRDFFDNGLNDFDEFMRELVEQYGGSLTSRQDYKDLCGNSSNSKYRENSTTSSSSTTSNNTSGGSCEYTKEMIEMSSSLQDKAFFFKIGSSDEDKDIPFLATGKMDVSGTRQPTTTETGYCQGSNFTCALTASNEKGVPASSGVEATRYIHKLGSYRRKSNKDHVLVFSKATKIDQAFIQVNDGDWEDVAITPFSNKKKFTLDTSIFLSAITKILPFKLILLNTNKNGKCKDLTKDIKI